MALDGRCPAIFEDKENKLNKRSQDAADKTMLAFDHGGILPIRNSDKYWLIDEHVRSILGRAMETKEEKKTRRYNNFKGKDRS